MAAGGLKFIESKLMHDAPNNKHFMIRTIDVAKKMMEFTQRYTYRAGKHLKAKIGIHYGSCIFGVLGYHKPQFSLIGDTINTTSRVCTTGAAENIILSQEAFKNVREIENQLIKNMKKKRESFERLQFIVGFSNF
jgi:class 3 adenylate cyclase